MGHIHPQSLKPENDTFQSRDLLFQGVSHFQVNHVKLQGKYTPVKHMTYSHEQLCHGQGCRYIGDKLIPPLIGILIYNGYINPYYWVDDHPLLEIMVV